MTQLICAGTVGQPQLWLMMKSSFFHCIRCFVQNTMMLGKVEGKRRREWKKMRWLDNITDSMDMNLSKLQEMVEDRGAWIVHGVAKSQAQLSNWTQQILHLQWVLLAHRLLWFLFPALFFFTLLITDKLRLINSTFN